MYLFYAAYLIFDCQCREFLLLRVNLVLYQVVWICCVDCVFYINGAVYFLRRVICLNFVVVLRCSGVVWRCVYCIGHD